MSRGGGVREVARKWGDTWDGGKPLLNHKGQGRGRQDKSPWRTGAHLVLLTGPASRAQRRAGSDCGAHAEEHAACGLVRVLLALRPTPSISPGNQVTTHALERMKDGRRVFTAPPLRMAAGFAVLEHSFRCLAGDGLQPQRTSGTSVTRS